MADLTASRARKATDKVLGFLYKKTELQRISAELLQWTERYHIRFGLLPLQLQERLLAGSGGVEDTTVSSLRSLRETFAQLTLRSQHIPNAGLLKTEGEVTLRSGPNASRMIAAFDQDIVLVEFKPHKNTLAGQEFSIFEYEVAKLVKILSCADEALCRILKAIGYFHQAARFCFALIYQLPRNVLVPVQATTPTTLLDIIKTTRESPNRPGHTELLPPQHPLEQRFELARKIACAVMYVHMMQYVHKSIRSSNIVILSKKGASSPETGGFPKQLGEPFLCGFETARQDKATSDQKGDAHWRYNIYRHPKRQGLYPQERYTMNHDIYSLGVVLLELGLWRPLLNTGLAKLKDSTDEEIAAGKIKEYLKKMAAERLPVMLGTKYCDIVLFCLNVDGDGQVGSSKVIEEILSKLEELSAGMQ
ncbi:hypothetical protein GQ44DRAFT_719490 [Phaeosphaeriaceae sp. PMI808]|nr:hypothetical protein GQ44DRAFT_719490 [Phaeosphaeriaceae sp. PMI808]